MITLVLFAALAIPPQQVTAIPETNAPIAPEQALAWQLEGLTQEEIREEVTRHGLTQCADDRLLNALSSARADAETIRVVKQAKAPCTVWKLGLRLPGPTDYLYEVASAIFRGDREQALQTMQDEVSKSAAKSGRATDLRVSFAHVARLDHGLRRSDGGGGIGSAVAALRARATLHGLLPLAPPGVCRARGDGVCEATRGTCRGLHGFGECAGNPGPGRRGASGLHGGEATARRICRNLRGIGKRLREVASSKK